MAVYVRRHRSSRDDTGGGYDEEEVDRYLLGRLGLIPDEVDWRPATTAAAAAAAAASSAALAFLDFAGAR